MPIVCSNKCISIWFCGNVDTCLNKEDMQDTEQMAKNCDATVIPGRRLNMN